MIRKAQVVAANLDPFRGAEPDSGTAFELGYALALGKKVCGYVTRLDTLARRVEIAEGRSIRPAPDTGRFSDRLGMWVEDFGLPCNLMLAVPTHIVEGGLEAPHSTASPAWSNGSPSTMRRTAFVCCA